MELSIQIRESFATARSGRDSQEKRTAPAGQPQASTKKAASVQTQITDQRGHSPPKEREQHALTVKYKKMPIFSSSE